MTYFFKPDQSGSPVPLNREQNELKATITNPQFELFKDNLDRSFSFNAREPSHLGLIGHMTATAKQKLLEVKAIDKEISAAFALGLLSSMSSLIPFNWLLAPAALMYTGYLAKERDTVYAEYTESLRQLHRCCNWAVNNGHNTTQEIMSDLQVQSMLEFLSKVMTTQQMANILADQHERTFFNSLLLPNQTLEQRDAAKEDSLDYKIYGCDQGGSITSILTKIAGYVKQTLTKAVTDAVVYLNTPEQASGMNFR